MSQKKRRAGVRICQGGCRRGGFRLDISVCAVVFLLLCGVSGADSGAVSGILGGQYLMDGETVRDSATGLMWASYDNGGDLSWSEALMYCDELVLAGHDDWRLPTPAELASLYDSVHKQKNRGLGISPLFRLSDFMFWSSEQHMCRVDCFDFTTGRTAKIKASRVGAARVLPVRNEKEYLSAPVSAQP